MSKSIKPIIVTQDMWDEVDMEHRLIVEQYLDWLTTVSDSTHNRYRVDVRQLVYWLHSSLNDKPLYLFNIKDFERFLQVLRTTGIAISTIESKKYSLCTFFNFIDEVIRVVDDRYEDFENNFKDAEIKTGIYSGESYPVTYEEFLLVIDKLRQEDYLIALAWVMFAFTTGSIGLEYRKLGSAMFKFPFPANADYVLSNTISRCVNKATGERQAFNFKIRREAFDGIKIWIDSRGYDSEYVFTSFQNGEASVVSTTWATALCQTTISPILGRIVTPKDFARGGETYLKEKKKHDKANSKRQLQNLIGIDLESEPIILKGYEYEINKILEEL